MKKLIVLVLVAVLSLGVVGPAMAAESSGPDLSSMSLDELVALKNDILQEIISRVGDYESFPSGVYVAGKDIKAGNYSIINYNTEDTMSYQIASVGVFPAGTDISDSTATPIMQSKIYAQEEFSVSLEDGMVLVIELREGQLGIRSTASASWAP